MINRNKFISWAEEKFSGDVIITEKEIKLNSIFVEDYKHHMWCNTEGGKHDRPNGVFHCWKSDERGSLISLVMKVEKCSYEEACDILGAGDAFLEDVEQKLNEIFAQAKPYDPADLVVKKENTFRFPDETYLINSLPEDNFFKINALLYLKSRKIQTGNLMVCTGPDREWQNDYSNKIIIPYYENGKLVYWNGRTLSDSKKVLRYAGPPIETGVGKEDVLYFKEWPKDKSIVYLTEGEFDSIALCQCGVLAGAFGGKNLSDRQIGKLKKREYSIVLGLDNDISGEKAVARMSDTLMANGFSVSLVRPPIGFKDWNSMYEIHKESVIKAYVLKNTKRLNPDSFMFKGL